MKDVLRKKAGFIIVFLFVCFGYFYGANKLPLLNRTDSRYAEIAREMALSGDFFVPRLIGSPHLHKPPLSYWFMALGMKIFGINEFGARFFQIIFSLLSLLFVYLIALKILKYNEKAFWAFVFTSVSPAFFFISRILATDIFLFFFEASAIFLYLKHWEENKSFWIYLFWLCLALGFLTKGPVALVVLSIIFVASTFRGGFREFKKFFSFKYLLLFAMVGFSWYIYLIILKPEVLRYFLIEQLYARIAGIKGIKIGHPKPFYYYFEILPVMVLPFYIPLVFALVSKIRKGLSERDFIPVAMFVFPLLFFSIFITKLPTYILLTVPGAAILTADWFSELKPHHKFFLSVVGFFPLFFLLNPRLKSLGIGESQMLNLIPFLCIFIPVLFLFSKFFKKGIIYLFFAGWLFVYLNTVKTFVKNPEIVKANRDVLRLADRIAGKNFTVVCYKQYAFQVPFYINELPLYCNVEFEREIDGFKNRVNCDFLKNRWEKDKFLILADKKDLGEFASFIGDAFVIANRGNVFVVSNKPLTGVKIRWKKGVNLHRYRPLKRLYRFIKVSFEEARKKVIAYAGKKANLHDEELALLNGRLYYEFEFLKNGKRKEFLIDANNGKVYTDTTLPSKNPRISEKDLNKIASFDRNLAEATAKDIVGGTIVERELEIENGVLCYSFHILKNKKDYEILIDSSNGLPFKISVENPPQQQQSVLK